MTKRPLSRRSFLKIVGASAAASSFGTFGTFLYAREVEPGWVDVNPIMLKLPRLPAAFDGYRVVHITDLHVDDAWMNRERLTEIVRLVNAQKPDLVAITGDFITAHPARFAADTIAALRLLEAPDGVFGVLGNHDHWSNATISRQILRESGVRELNNSTFSLTRQQQQLHLVGLDDLWPIPDQLVALESFRPRLAHLAATLPAGGTAILLAHEPDIAAVSAAVGRFDLQLSGHSHGGQVRVPGHGTLIVPFLAHKYPDGRYQVGSMIQYTGRGLGMAFPQVRFNCRPEITVFSLTGDA